MWWALILKEYSSALAGHWDSRETNCGCVTRRDLAHDFGWSFPFVQQFEQVRTCPYVLYQWVYASSAWLISVLIWSIQCLSLEHLSSRQHGTSTGIDLRNGHNATFTQHTSSATLADIFSLTYNYNNASSINFLFASSSTTHQHALQNHTSALCHIFGLKKARHACIAWYSPPHANGLSSALSWGSW